MSLDELNDEYEYVFQPPVSAADAEEAEAAVDTVIDALEQHLPRWAQARKMIALRRDLRATLALHQRDFIPSIRLRPFRQR